MNRPLGYVRDTAHSECVHADANKGNLRMSQLTTEQQAALDQLRQITEGTDPDRELAVLASVDWNVEVRLGLYSPHGLHYNSPCGTESSPNDF
jgi:hypothetical protein